MTAGPPATSMLATWLSITGPRLPGTIRRSRTLRSLRASPCKRTTIGTCRSDKLSLGKAASKSPSVATRKVSLMAALVTPKSAALAKSGRTAISGRTKLAVEAIEPKPGMVRKSRSTAIAAVCSACGSSPVSTKMYFSPEPPKPTLVRTPGKSCKAVRMSLSISCLRGRVPRSVN